MSEPVRATVAVLLLVGGLALCGCAGYLQYVVLPGEHSLGQRSKRALLAVGGLILVLFGTWLLT